MGEILHITSEELEILISERTIELQNKIKKLENSINISDLKSILNTAYGNNIQIIFDNLQDSIWLLDLDLKITWVNPSKRFTNGFSPEELSNLPLEKIFAPCSFKKAREIIATYSIPEILQDKSRKLSIKENFELNKKNGDTYWVEMSIILMRNNEGIATGYIGIGRDITGQIITEKAIQETEFWINESQRIAKLGSYILDFAKNQWSSSAVLDDILGIDEHFTKDIESWYSLIAPEHHQPVEDHFQYCITNKLPYRIEFKIIRPADNQVLWMLAQGEIVFDDKENVIKIPGILQDISEQKRTADILSETVELYQSFISATPDAIVVTDSAGNITYLSPKAAELFGYDSAKEIIGQNCLNWVAFQDKAKAANDLKRAIRGEITTSNEYIFHKKDGSLFYGEINVSIQYNVKGEGKGFVSIIRDTTERKKSQEQLIISEEKFAKAFMSSPIPINIVRLSDETYIDVNEAFLKLTAYTRNELIGKKTTKLNIWTEPGYHTDFINLFKQNNRIRNMEAIFKTKYEKTVHANVSSEIIFINNEACILSINEDITERKKAEEILKENEQLLREQNEEYLSLNEVLIESNERIRKINQELIEAKEKAIESDRLKSTFLANMSHEIRTPMNAILGFSQLLEKKELPKDKRIAFTRTIKQRATDLLGIINDIIDISKIESGTLHIYEEPGMVEDMLNDVRNFFIIRNDNIQKKPIDFRILNHLNIDHNYINTDFSRLSQVLINLIENAYKFTASGYIEIGCSLANYEKLVFYVKDTGIGISKENQAIIFDRFRQAEDHLVARKYGGTGLGLSISRGILELLHGRIWVESEEACGTTFFFEIPFQQATKTLENKINTESQLFNWEPYTTLIVEDMDYNALIIEEYLKSTNVKTLWADTGAKAIELFYKHPEISIILMDIRLTDTNGFDLTRKIKTIRKGVAIIAQTAYASDEDKTMCLQAGCDGFISKPISEDDLLEAMSRFLP